MNPQDNNNELTLFKNVTLNASVRGFMGKDGKPYFVAKDIAEALGYANTNDAIRTHTKGVVKRYPLQTAGGVQQVRVISEGDMYRLIASSKLPTAEKFESWIFDIVLPTIRKHGAYATPQTIENIINNPDFGIKLLETLKNERAQRVKAEKTIEEQKPKVLFADALTTSKSSVLVGELAKILRQNGIEIGQNRLFKWLRANGYLSSRKGEDWNMPTQRSQERGWFEIKTSTHNNPDGSSMTVLTPKVTGKGQQYFVSKLIQHPELVGDAK